MDPETFAEYIRSQCIMDMMEMENGDMTEINIAQDYVSTH
jgi:hypothetical protein